MGKALAELLVLAKDRSMIVRSLLKRIAGGAEFGL